jgi:2-polyprenyl-6-methoxyphenol hydroxylase-like FAD-dependent oxidoreductase
MNVASVSIATNEDSGEEGGRRGREGSGVLFCGDAVSLSGRPVTVIGGGVAGLAVARAMALRGAAVTLHEQAPAIGEVGAGLQISPNGLRVVDSLGLGDALRAVAVRASAIRLRDYRGADVLRLDLARHAPDAAYLLVHRARLVEVLEQGARAAGVAVRTGSRLDPSGRRADHRRGRAAFGRPGGARRGGTAVLHRSGRVARACPRS